MQRHKDIIKVILNTQSSSSCCYHVMHELELSLKTKLMAEPNRDFKTWKINRSFSKTIPRSCIALLGPSFSLTKYNSPDFHFRIYMCAPCAYSEWKVGIFITEALNVLATSYSEYSLLSFWSRSQLWKSSSRTFSQLEEHQWLWTLFCRSNCLQQFNEFRINAE